MAESRRERTVLSVEELEEFYRRSGRYAQYQRNMFGREVEAGEEEVRRSARPTAEGEPLPEPLRPRTDPRLRPADPTRQSGRAASGVEEELAQLASRVQQWEDRLLAFQTELGAWRRQIEHWSEEMRRDSQRLLALEVALQRQEEQWESIARQQALPPSSEVTSGVSLSELQRSLERLRTLLDRRWETERKARQRLSQRLEAHLGESEDAREGEFEPRL